MIIFIVIIIIVSIKYKNNFSFYFCVSLLFEMRWNIVSYLFMRLNNFKGYLMCHLKQ